MLTAVIFDFDGIIVDSEPLHFNAFNEVLNPLGISMTWEAYCETYIGFDDRDAFRTIFKANRHKDDTYNLAQLIEQKAAVFQRCIQNGAAKPLPGAVELIKSIPARLPVGLCSGALRQDIDPIIQNLGIENCFSTIVTAEDTPISKPDPAPYILALEKLKMDEPAAVVAIEDTPTGIQSAKAAGMKVLAVTNSYDRDYLMDADAIVDSLEKVTRPTLENLVL